MKQDIKVQEVIYIPSYYKESPAVLMLSAINNGFYTAILFNQDGKQVAICSDKQQILSFMDIEQIRKIWGDKLREIKPKTLDGQQFVFGADGLISIYATLNSNDVNFSICENYNKKHTCEHIDASLKNIQMQAVDMLLSYKNIHIQKNDNNDAIDQGNPQDKKFDIKNITFDLNDDIEKAIANAILLGKNVMLFGATGSGKTTTVTNFFHNNNIKLFTATIGQNSEYKTALYGEKDLNTLDGENTILNFPGSLTDCLRYIKNTKKPAGLFVDEAFRQGGLDFLTTLSPLVGQDGRAYYYLKGIALQRFAFVINSEKKIKTWVLIDNAETYHFDKRTGMPNFIVSDIFADNTFLVDKANEGSITQITKNDLENFGYKIRYMGNLYQEAFKIPVDKLLVVFAGNYGARYNISEPIDDAVLSRSVAVIIDPLKMTPSEMIRKIQGKTSRTQIQMRELNEKNELKKIERQIAKFFTALEGGIQNVDIELPQKAYSLRNMSDLLKIKSIPTNQEPSSFFAEIVQNYLVFNYIEHSIGKESPEFDERQQNYIQQALTKAFDLPQQKKDHAKTQEKEQALSRSSAPSMRM